jgi:CheY-like chemotaxis protein/signal transduction histidine kinase/HAMP domain-containing protein
MIRLVDIRIRPKIMSMLVIFAVVPMIATAIFSARLASDALIEKSFQELNAIQSLRSTSIDTFFKERLISLDTLARTIRLKEFIQNMDERQVTTKDDDSSFFETFISNYDYDDFLILDPKEATILFSIKEKPRLGSLLAANKGNDPALTQAWNKAITSGETAFSDFDSSNTLGQQKTAYFSSPVRDSRGNIIAVVAVKILPSLISNIVDSRVGLGKTGESYLIGENPHSTKIEFRSDLATMGNGRYVVGFSFDKDLGYWTDAKNAREIGGQNTYIDSAGRSVLVIYTQLNVPGYNWHLISKINEDEVTEPIFFLYQAIFAAAAIVFFIISFIAVNFSRSVTDPLIHSMKFAQDIAKGTLNTSLVLDRGDEIGDLGLALNNMAEKLRELDWINSGKESLDNQLRGDLQLSDLSNLFISFFSKHMNAQLGALYLLDQDILVLKSSYSFTDRQGNFNQIRLGEGMVGQAALEKEILIFSGVVQNAPVLNYGVGEVTPSHFMAIPLAVDEHLLGVVLLGSITPFSALQKTFVREVIGSAAILFNAANARLEISSLLEQAQHHQESLSKSNHKLKQQTEALILSEQALQTQQEELRVTNEELEEQTKVLKESETELQAQQEELRVTNEELEERTKALESQQIEMQGKNDQLYSAQQIVEEKAKELEISSKYKSEFLANMSHELRTPLNSILILSQLFANNKDNNLTNKQIESANAINSSGADLLSLINEILDLSKVEAGKVDLHIEDVSFTAIESDISRLYQDMAADKGVDFQINLADNLPDTIRTDSQRLQQVLRNLLTNAFKFTHEGAVTLDIARPSAEIAKKLHMPLHNLVAFSVKDDGIGIKKEQHLAIFQAFQQADGSTSRNYGGTGLGLSISKELTHLLGGSIELQSEEGKGCTFTVFLPLEYQAKGASAENVPKLLAPKIHESRTSNSEAAVISVAADIPKIASYVEDDRQSIISDPAPEDKTLLIIEDDRAFAGVMRDFGRERGFKCIVAETGETGLHFADYYKPSAIILDIGLPGIDGWTVMERLKENPSLRHIPVHFMSASDNNLEAMRMGAIGYLTKPVDIKKLDKAFANIEGIISKSVKRLLIVEDDDIQRASIKQLIGEDDLDIVAVSTGKQALDELERNRYDCMILDLGLEDISGFELLEAIRRSETAARVPIIVYTGRDLTAAEEKELNRYAESIIIKGVKSPERLLDESALFLHRIEANLPAEQRRILKAVHNKESVLSGKKVLLVDDDMRNVFALSSILEDKGMDITIARDGMECLVKLTENPDVDIVLMDIMMPKMDGYEAMQQIRMQRKHNNLPIIALTAKAMKGDRSKCIEAGASDYLTKPIDSEKLLSMIRVWLY